MGVIDFINRKKAMHFKTRYSGEATKAPQLGAGVEKYGKKSIGERINEAKNRFQQKKAETQLLRKEKPQPTRINPNTGSFTPPRTSGKLAQGILKRLEARAKEKRTITYATNNSAPYYTQTTPQNTPFTMQNDNRTQAIYFGNRSNNNPFDFTQEKITKEKTKNIIIKIPK